MCKKGFVVSFVAGLICLLAFVNQACDKDTNCYVNVTVIDEITKQPVPGAFVKIDIENSAVNAEGVTDNAGLFTTQFKAPAIFNVVATLETGYNDLYTREEFYCYRKGSNTIRLKEGETVNTTVNLERDTLHDFRR